MKYDQSNLYKETRVRTSSGGQLIVILYDACIQSLDTAIAEFKAPKRRLDRINTSIIKAQDVISELMSSLNLEEGGAIGQNLFSLYLFFNRRLTRANLEKESTEIEAVRNLMIELREAWVAIDKTPPLSQTNDREGVNIAG